MEREREKERELTEWKEKGGCKQERGHERVREIVREREEEKMRWKRGCKA